ncbi:hypothetical protein N8H74_14850 [Pseudomonas sp. B2M1-30]|uniref:hypothetical protein n=1 Tax=Pseudomonas TaxID=286 RepID=UPI0021C7A540|nr:MULTISPECIES: hypothetical protein [Pseudomonas]MCU0119542.1 hypothetical protein [Pseudomonas sp. B2M1-30]MCU7262356.1 hypothetical protein [Pseudomonas koreensis]
MKTYARIVENTVVELFSTEGNISEMFHPDLLWVDITDVIPAPQIDWTANFGTLGWVYSSPESQVQDGTLKTLAKKWLAGFSGQS